MAEAQQIREEHELDRLKVVLQEMLEDAIKLEFMLRGTQDSVRRLPVLPRLERDLDVAMHDAKGIQWVLNKVMNELKE